MWGRSTDISVVKLTWFRSFSCKTGSSVGGIPAAISLSAACCHLLGSDGVMWKEGHATMMPMALCLKQALQTAWASARLHCVCTKTTSFDLPNASTTNEAVQQPPCPFSSLLSIFVLVPSPSLRARTPEKRRQSNVRHCPSCALSTTEQSDSRDLDSLFTGIPHCTHSKKAGESPLTTRMAVLASPPFFLAVLAFLFVLICSLISPTEGAELVPDQWHEFEVPVVPEDKVMFEIIKEDLEE